MESQALQLMVTYPTSVVMQNGGFIAIQNADYNGGYEFASYAWAKDGEPMGVTTSYLPTSPANIGSTYVLSLVREGEDYAIESCPILYNPYAQGVDELSADNLPIGPTSVRPGGTLWLAPSPACVIYSVLGTAVARHPQSDDRRTVSAPTQAGLYYVVFDNHQSIPIIVH